MNKHILGKRIGGKYLKTLFLSSLAFFCLFFLISTQHRQKYSEYLLKSLEGPIKYDDPQLISYLQEKVLTPPSKSDYNLANKHARDYRNPSEKFYEHFARILFQGKRNGFFVEAGALDGQSMSNTLELEVKRGWTGLLVEPDPSNYIALKKKNRKAWIANACLSLYKYPKEERLSSLDLVMNHHEFTDIKHRSMGSIVQEDGNKGITNDETTNSYYNCKCFPIASFLVALNVTVVDLFSLDVEFVEEAIISNFDFARFDVHVFFIEWWKHDRLLWLNEFMKSKGYSFVANSLSDIIFVKDGTREAEIANTQIPNKTMYYFTKANESQSAEIDSEVV